MITLITGTPGSGKTLYTVWSIAREQKAGRQLMVDGIRDLAIDHVDVDEPWLRKWFDHRAHNDLIVIDEAQRIWPPTSVSVKVSEDIEKLHVHRHLGVDFYLITQHPQRINKTVRDLVGRHVHVRKLFGMNRAMLYEWDHCHNVASLRDAVKTMWAYPRDVFKLYTSAEIHTKQKAVIPKALFILPVALIAVVVFGVAAFHGVRGGFGVGSHGGGASGAAVAASGPVSSGGGGRAASPSWRVAGRYLLDGGSYVVLADGAGRLRVEDSNGYAGGGVHTSGEADGVRVAGWTGTASDKEVRK
ncbi:zonular occludens toxin domain-containing protein [Paraburkholderia sp.]|uniref:zonular occludens toxin domain-containing protein n=1 Tax=Paraburkholderia sp. TaxID=1926495 RepID=UPI003D6E7796